MSELVSVVVPVYNTEPYIERCVESLLAQTYAPLEILLVDDGSSDGSRSVCAGLAERYENVRLLCRENSGAAAARYEGTCAAAGAYVAFVDSDDFVDPQYISAMYDAIRRLDADGASCVYRRVPENAPQPPAAVLSDPEPVDAARFFGMMFYEKRLNATVNTKMFRADRLKAIRPEKLLVGEDSYVCYQYFLDCGRIAVTTDELYYYVQRESSALHSYEPEIFYDYVVLADQITGAAARRCPPALPAFVNRLVEDNFVVYLKLGAISKQVPDKIEHIRNNIKKYRRRILFDRRAEPRTRLACLASYAGLRAVAVLYRLKKR